MSKHIGHEIESDNIKEKGNLIKVKSFPSVESSSRPEQELRGDS